MVRIMRTLASVTAGDMVQRRRECQVSEAVVGKMNHRESGANVRPVGVAARLV